MPKSHLPAEVHDHFRKANILHGYVQKDLDEATKHALETGQELLAAKATAPHGSWETECDRLFDGKLRTAQFYMQFAKHVSALPKAQASALLVLEGTLQGAAKAAKKAANPPARQTASGSASTSKGRQTPAGGLQESGYGKCRECNGAGTIEKPAGMTGTRAYKCKACDGSGHSKPDYGKCPNCAGTKWDEDEDGVCCSKCHHPHGEPAGDVDEDRIKTQRQKTIKTIEALIRAFDDLQAMQARRDHSEAIAACKGLLKTARAWK